jgi:putative membrane protein
MTNSGDSNETVRIPTPIRVGGAFMAVAIVLAFFTVVEVITNGWMMPFAVTPRFLALVLAGALVGGFATMNKNQPPSIIQVTALVAALVLVVAGRFLPQTVLMVWDQYWLPAYALLAFACSLAIRRSLIPKR